MSAQFRFLSGARAGEVETVRKSYIGIGRHPLCDLRFDTDRDLDVSARHAAVLRREGGFYLQDLGSRNGTFVNGARLSGERALADGDVIGFGPNGPTIEFRALAGDDGLPETHGAESLARRSSRPRDPVPAAPRRSSTTVRIAREVARQTRHLRRATKLLLVALVAAVGALAAVQWTGARDRARELARLAARADTLARDARTLTARFEGEVQILRDALAHSQAETTRLRRELSEARGSDPRTLARLRDELDAAELRQRGLLGAAAVDYRAIARRNQDAVAIVLVEFSASERYAGTAFAVDSAGILVTNRHLLAGPDGRRTPRRIGVMFPGSRQNFPARIVGLASQADLGVLRTTVAGGVPRVGGPFGDAAAVERGDPVALLGYPHGFDLPMERVGATPVADPTLTVGTVSKVLHDVLQLDGYGAPGSSGSPVFDRDGRVIGVLFGGAQASQGNIVYAVPAHVVATYLRTLGITPPGAAPAAAP